MLDVQRLYFERIYRELTVVQSATLAATESIGMFRVIWDSVSSPNMKYPMTATLPYIMTHKEKLHNR